MPYFFSFEVDKDSGLSPAYCYLYDENAYAWNYGVFIETGTRLFDSVSLPYFQLLN